MPKKVLAEVDLTALAVPVEKPTRKRKAKAEPEDLAKPESSLVRAHPEKVTHNVSETVVTETVKQKKPRTEKQLAADEKRRQAALAKKEAAAAEEARIKAEEVSSDDALSYPAGKTF